MTEFEDAELEELQSRVARKLGFEVASHRLELYGRCPRCTAQGRSGRSAHDPGHRLPARS